MALPFQSHHQVAVEVREETAWNGVEFKGKKGLGPFLTVASELVKRSGVRQFDPISSVVFSCPNIALISGSLQLDRLPVIRSYALQSIISRRAGTGAVGAMGRSGIQTTGFCIMLVVAIVLLVDVNQVDAQSVDSFSPPFSAPASAPSPLSFEEDQRRVLATAGRTGFISYLSLSANRVPCPPQSGRSYYTFSCMSATGPVRPYTRGCSRITSCQRDSG